MNNNYVKFDCGKFYEVTTVNSDLYKSFSDEEREKFIPLTEEETACVNDVWNNRYVLSETLTLTRKVFGKSTFIYL